MLVLNGTLPSIYEGSEPSLQSQTSVSKHVAVSYESHDRISPAQSPVLASQQSITAENRTPVHSQQRSDNRRQRELKLGSPQMPIIADTAEFFPTDTTPRTPSYLRLSSAVSGYGHYSKYSSYRGIEKRSPYSSTLSLRSSRSDLATPVSPLEMPIGKLPNIQAPTNYPPLRNEIMSPTAKGKFEGKFDDVDSSPAVVNGAKHVEPVTVNSVQVSNNDVCVNGNGCDDVKVNGQNGHLGLIETFEATGDPEKDADYFLTVSRQEEDRLLVLCSQCERELRSDSIPEEGSGKIRSAVGKANLLTTQKFKQFQELCNQHKYPDPNEKPTLWEDLQGFWDMVKMSIHDIDEMFTEIELMRQNGWQEIKIPSRRSSASSRSSPKSGSINVSNASTPSHTPGSKRRARVRDTPDSSPERSQKAKMAAKVRDDARKRMLAEKRAAMKQQKQQQEDNVEIYVPDKVTDSLEGSPEPTQPKTEVIDSNVTENNVVEDNDQQDLGSEV
ncbi:DLGP4-like protein [Mya arenaria]|uniref:DLGP4-like protein n=1 Tax=Mya arenaria TaxID=6604 RepID=A0ABY7E6T8_MYAAR|nr:DLGP4-like protein [Mya arenaria]